MTWSTRHHIITDGVSYLDIATEVNNGDLAALGNSYWSPAYPAFIGAGLFLLRPSAANEVPVLQLVNFFIFILTLGAFSLFFRYWSRSIPEFEQAGSRDKGLFTLFAFASFLWFTASLVIIPFPTPDMMVVAIVLFVAAMGCRISQPGAGWKHFAGLGALLGLGIYVKSALFPLAFVFIALFFISQARSLEIPRKRQWAFLALTTAMCAVVAAPLIICMSVQAGKFTTGDAGKLNYLWNVNGFEPNHVGWAGGTAPAYGTPLHPPRKLMENPTVLEFETPTAETYPLWHSPGYWYAGAKTVFSLRQQIDGIRKSLDEYGSIAIRAIGFIGGAIVLFALGMSKGKRAQRWRISLWMVAWPLAGCAMYSIVRIHPRYVTAFLLILCLEIYRALVFRVERRVAIGVCAIALLVAMTPLLLRVSKTFATSVRQLRHPVDEDYVVAAHNLQHLGLQPGDKVAVAGFALNCFYARYDRLRIVSQILTPDDFWRLNPTDAKRVEDRLASIGVKALIVYDHPARNEEAGWTNVGAFGGGSLNVLLLQPASDPSNQQRLGQDPGIAAKSSIHSPVDAEDKHSQASTVPIGEE